MQGADDNSCQADRSTHRPLWLRQRDQTTLFGIAVCLLIAMAGLWVYRGGQRGHLIEIDRAAPLHAQFSVDINRADWPELLQLPGLGETLARRIVEHRLEHGSYTSLQQIQDVNGIGPRTFDRVLPYLAPIAEDRDVAATETGQPQT